jgi:bifunctional non-homologous end joining protein LigD
VVKGYEYETGKYVVVTDDDFREAAGAASKRPEILDFAPGDDIDLIARLQESLQSTQKGGKAAKAARKRVVRKKSAQTMATRGSSKLAEYRRKRRFDVTHEPRGVEPTAHRKRVLRFYVQKHEASHLHFDFRLELDGVLRSWAVPKGPSLAPAVRRLAVQVEDHPVEYGNFEGTIPEGEYGGGTVMLWDRGAYRRVEPAEDEERALLRDLKRGRLSILLDGERLRGGFALIRTSPARGGRKAKWLLIKERDEQADDETDPVAEFLTSVASGRTMPEIAAGTKARRKGGGKRRSAPKSGRSRKASGNPAPGAAKKPTARKTRAAGSA